MSQINPFVGSLLQSTQVQRHLAAQKDRQTRREIDLTKNAALADDQLEHTVESAEELRPIDDGRPREDFPRRQGRDRHLPNTPDDTVSGLDITA